MSFLGDFLDSVENLPSDLRTHALALRQMDERMRILGGAADKAYAQAGSRKRGSAAFKRDVKRARGLEAQAVELAEAKSSLASCMYDVVDCHVRRLDDDLRRFETELILSGISTNDISKLEDRIRGARHRSRAAAAAEADPAASDIPGATELPVDPNEPVYCLCRRVAFGDMIMCDNADCPYEWFHFRCVGITQSNRPKGRWLCQRCNALRKKGLLTLPES